MNGDSGGEPVCLRPASLLLCFLLLAPACPADCLPFPEAKKHIGEVQCITGKVLRVKPGNKGVTFFDFCEDYRVCPFTVVIFPGDLKDVGDVRQLQGREIEIHGTVKMYDGRAEIILRESRQLTGASAQIPPLPKGYDVEKKGRYSAGKFKYPSSKRQPAKKRQGPPIQTEEPEDTGLPPE